MSDTKIIEKKEEVLLPKPVYQAIYGPDDYRSTCKFDDPCPPWIPGDSKSETSVNEWVLNHLPFRSEEQRDAFHQQLVKDQRMKERKVKSKTLPLKKKKKPATKGGARLAVKESTKHISKSEDEESSKTSIRPDPASEHHGEGGSKGRQGIDS